MKNIYLSVISTFLLLSSCIAQTANDYRSRITGIWNDAGSWERFDGTTWQTAVNPPDSTSGMISIRNADTLRINSSVNADQLVIDSGGKLIVDNMLTVADGTGTDLTINGTADLVSGSIAGIGNILLNKVLNWSSGYVSCITTIASTGVVNYSPTNVIGINAGFTNNGTVNWTSGDFVVSSLFINNANFNMSGTVDDLRLIGSGSFVNSLSGTVTKTASNLMSIDMNFTNNGLINVQDGRLRNADSNFISAGTISISAGKTFQNISVMNFNSGTVFSGTGTLQLTASEIVNMPLTIASTVITMFDGGEITGSGPLTFNGVLNWSTGILSCVTTISSTGVVNYSPTNTTNVNANFTNNGTVNWTSGDFVVSSLFTNNANFNMSGTVDNLRLIGSGSFVNSASGTVTKTASNLMSINMKFTNNGLISVQDGILRNADSNFISAGTISISAGKTFQNTSVINFNSGTVFSGTGTLQLTASEIVNMPLTIASTIITMFDGGEITGSGPLTFNGVLNWSTGILSCVTTISSTGVVNYSPTNIINVNANFTNNGTVNYTSGDFIISSSFTNNASFNMSGTVDDLRLIGSGSFVNSAIGTVTKTATNLMSINMNFTNSGLISVQDGILRNADSNFISAGTISISAGKTFQNISIINFNSGTVFSGTGTLQLTASEIVNVPLTIASTVITSFDGGEISGSGSLTFNGVLNWSTGYLSCLATISPAGILNYKATNVTSLNANFTNNGTVNWTGGDLPVKNSVLTNNASFIINETGDLTNGGGGSFVNSNSGTIDKTTNSFITCYLPLSNSGTLKGIGSVLFNDRFINTGTVAPGTATGNVLGSTIGTLNINGNENPLTASSVLDIEIANNLGTGNGNDEFQRGGNLVLTGDLKVRETGIVAPGTFTIISLTSGLITGAFTTVNLPTGYTLQQTLTTVTVTKGLTLPLKFVSVKATKTLNGIEIDWSTFSEQNTAFFTVEKSADAALFTSIGKVSAAGTSAAQNDYSLLDAQPFAGNNYYRISIHQNDGSTTYSSIVKVNTGTKTLLQAYPNPTTGLFTITGLPADKINDIVLFDQTGKKLQQYRINANSFVVDITKYLAGIYFVFVNKEQLLINKQ